MHEQATSPSASAPATPLPDLEGGYYSLGPPPPAGTFDIGLVMAGAISAGAYSAGVIDFLIEALDDFEAHKAQQGALHGPDSRNWSIPGHRARLRVMAGASAGSIVSAIAAAALRYDFVHVHADTEDPERSPFYRAWVKDIDIHKLLATRDLDAPEQAGVAGEAGAPVASLLDSSCLSDIADATFSYRGTVVQRPYLHTPVRYVFSLNNVRGIPYFVNMSGNTSDGFAMVAHGDYAGFDVRYHLGNGPDAEAAAPARADDVRLHFPNSPDSWRAMSTAALGSGAFPIFLAARHYQPDAAKFRYRFLLGPSSATGQLGAIRLEPVWGRHAPNPYVSAIIDGGTLNNAPIELARTELAGLAGINPRSGALANRAIVLIDPFPDRASATDDAQRGKNIDLLSSALALFEGWRSQARFRASDLALADAGTIYSRFLIAPDRGLPRDGPGYDLACGALDGFSGFLHERFRRHDYLLGRRNCQQFLRRHFGVPIQSNAHLASAINPELCQGLNQWTYMHKGALHMPLIPLFGALAKEEALPDWPEAAFDPESLRGAIDRRIAAVVHASARAWVRGRPARPWWWGPAYRLLSWTLLRWARRHLVGVIIAAIRRDLAKRKLSAG